MLCFFRWLWSYLFSLLHILAGYQASWTSLYCSCNTIVVGFEKKICKLQLYKLCKNTRGGLLKKCHRCYKSKTIRKPFFSNRYLLNILDYKTHSFNQFIQALNAFASCFEKWYLKWQNSKQYLKYILYLTSILFNEKKKISHKDKSGE